MRRFKNNILVVFGEALGDDDSLAQAATLAKRNNARLTIVDVLAEDLRPNAIAEKGELLHRLAASLGQDCVALETDGNHLPYRDFGILYRQRCRVCFASGELCDSDGQARGVCFPVALNWA